VVGKAIFKGTNTFQMKLSWLQTWDLDIEESRIIVSKFMDLATNQYK